MFHEFDQYDKVDFFVYLQDLSRTNIHIFKHFKLNEIN